MKRLSAAQVIATLGLKPHPEGGYCVESYRHQPADGGRGAMTAIYYLLHAGEHSAWHRVTDADEVWHHYAGAPLQLSLSADGEALEVLRLGPDLAMGERPQAMVPAGCWQAARSLGEWTLAGCTVGPAFDFATFELAPPGFAPKAGD